MNDLNNIQDIERNILAILLSYPNLIDSVQLKSNCFSNNVNKFIYESLIKYHEFNFMDIFQNLGMDIANYCVGLIESNPYSKSAKSMLVHFSTELLERYKQASIDNLQYDFQIGHMSYKEFVEGINKVNELTLTTEKQGLTKELFERSLTENEKYIRINGFYRLSTILKIEESDIITIAGESGLGKSAFSMNNFMSLIKDSIQDFKCQYFNIEIGEKEFARRLLAIGLNEEISNLTHTYQSSRYESMVDLLTNDGKALSFNGSMSIEELKRIAITNLDESKTNVLFVDHIGLLNVENKNYNKTEYDRVSYCMTELRKLALDNNLIIFVTSQFDRQSIRSSNISMHSLKSSGEIENSSTHVLLLTEQKPQGEEVIKQIEENQKKGIAPKWKNIQVNIAKNRHGQTTIINDYKFFGAKQTFSEPYLN